MNKEINELVTDMIKEHEGGEKFFDALDESIRNNDNLLEIMSNKVYNYCEKHGIYYIILSGKFGRMFSNYLMDKRLVGVEQETIVVNGDLRFDEVDDFGKMLNHPDAKYLFVDDSFYLGRTRNKIKGKIESYGGQLVHTVVFYDGSKYVDNNVESMYRYYDNN